MNSAVKYFVYCAQVFANLVCLADDVVKKADVWVLVTDKVMDGNVASLAVTIQASVALL